MLVPLSWLNDYVDINISADELEKKLFDCGFEVEEKWQVGKDISGIVVGYVESCEPIPETHLHVCQVNVGGPELLQICCGADNVKAGGKFPVAMVGAQVYATAKDHVTIEGVATIKKGKLRGYESYGMLCSGTELGLNEDLYPGAGYNGLLVLPEDAQISFYQQGEFVDLCAGPHLMSTKPVKAFKLTSLAGAYWRGSEKNKMLTRIYGTSFTKKADLEAYITRMEEAKKRDHRKLGKQLGLFMLRDEGPGFPFFLPNGMILKNTLLDYWREIHRKAGYVEISTPIMLSRHLWETSGHWDHYKENMYTTVIDDTDFAIKPMNCPGGILVYQSEPRSYRDLPLRMGELGLVHRHEKSGQLHGLMRVRCFTQDDAHIFMMPEQIREEIKGVAKLIDEVYQLFGFKYHVELSTRPENSMGSDEDWEMATEALRGALDDLGRDYVVNEGDGAFYGPKIDFHLEDSIGRTWQCGTIQLDFQLPQRFECEYIGADGEKHRPIMIHRVAFGSIERFIGILIEHFAGAFPTWLSPEQVRVLPISDKYLDYAQQVNAKLNDEGVRSSVDSRAEKIGYKIRDARLQKVPYMLIVGAKEEEEKLVSVRSRFAGDEGQTTLDAFLDNIKEEIRTRVLRETVAEEDEKKKD